MEVAFLFLGYLEHLVMNSRDSPRFRVTSHLRDLVMLLFRRVGRSQISMLNGRRDDGIASSSH